MITTIAFIEQFLCGENKIGKIKINIIEIFDIYITYFNWMLISSYSSD